jgi:UDP-glucose 4-epimerase
LQSRDFTYIDNVVQANLQAAHSKLGAGEVFNVGEGKTHTLIEVVGDPGSEAAVAPYGGKGR